MDSTKIKMIIADKGFTINSLSKRLKMSHVGLSKGIDNKTIKITTIEKMSKILEVPMVELLADQNDSFYDQFKKRRAHDKKVYGTAYSFIMMIQNVSSSFDLDNEDLKTVSTLIHDHFHEL